MTSKTPDCIDLRHRFGARYRITHDPAAVTWGERRDPWMMELRCEGGTIYPLGGSKLAVEVDGRPWTAKALATLPGDTETTFAFDVSRFDAVAQIVRPRKRRQVSEAERQRLAELSRRH